VKIPKTQALPGNSRQCLALAANRGSTEGILAVLVQLEVVPVFGKLLTSLFKLHSLFIDDSHFSSILILQHLNPHLLESTPGLEIFKLLCVLLSYSSDLLVMTVLMDFFT
jgi:hypothetical protein